MVLMCAGMSSGPSVSWRQPAFSGASRFSAVVKSTSTVGSAFSWIVSDAEVWRMNSVTAPSRACTSRTNFATSAVRSVKPVPRVSTVSNEDAMVLAATAEGVVRESNLVEAITRISPHVVPANAGTHNPRRLDFETLGVDILSNNPQRWLWVPAFAGTTRENPIRVPSNLAVDIPLHPVGHFDQAPPGLLEERHHAIHVAVARQRDFDLALALRHLRLGRLQRIRFRQRLFDLAGHCRLARGEVRLESFGLGLQPDDVGLQTADLGIHRRALVGHGIAGPARTRIVAGRNCAGSRIEPKHAICRRRQRIATVLGVRLPACKRLPGACKANGQNDAAEKLCRRFCCAHGLAPASGGTGLLDRRGAFKARPTPSSYRASGRTSMHLPANRGGPAPRTPRLPAHRPASRTRRTPARPAGSVHT